MNSALFSALQITGFQVAKFERTKASDTKVVQGYTYTIFVCVYICILYIYIYIHTSYMYMYIYIYNMAWRMAEKTYLQ